VSVTLAEEHREVGTDAPTPIPTSRCHSWRRC
jgi:hypothetical protein